MFTWQPARCERIHADCMICSHIGFKEARKQLFRIILVI